MLEVAEGGDVFFRRGSVGQRADGVFTGEGAYGGAEGPFNGFVDWFIEDVGEEGDDGETELGGLVSLYISSL
jgi:hypothetical protein